MPRTLSPEPCNLKPRLARHYHSDLSIWLSVNPMSDKYPSTSPYTYCANNPVVLKDPNGEEIWEIDEWGRIVASYENNVFDQVYVPNNGVSLYDKYTPYLDNGKMVYDPLLGR